MIFNHWIKGSNPFAFNLMQRFHLIILSILIIILSFFEFIIFDEEVLLTLCFVCFMFFAYSFLNLTVFNILKDDSNKIETNLLLAFNENYKQVLEHSTSISIKATTTIKTSIFLILENFQFANYNNCVKLELKNLLTRVTANLLNDAALITSSSNNNIRFLAIRNIVYKINYQIFKVFSLQSFVKLIQKR